MESYRTAAIQMNSQPDLDHNLEQAYRLVREAAFEGCRLACLPENFAWMDEPEERGRRAGEIASRSRAFLMESAAEFGLWLSGGTLPEPCTGGGRRETAEHTGDMPRVWARSLLAGPEGELLATYDKIHLFDVDLPGGESYRESDYIRPGETGPVAYEGEEIGTLGLSVCYDLRFPELYRELVRLGAEVLLVPSAFTHTTGSAHWHALLRARAIENTSWVVAAAQAGRHGGDRRTYGHALIADPWGEIVAEADEESTGMAIAELGPARLEEVRRSIPSLQHRRL